MSTLLIIGGCILGYLIIGLCWARSQAVRLQGMLNVALAKRVAHVEDHPYRSDWLVDEFCKPWYGYELRRALGWWAALWIAFAPIHVWASLLRWVEKPVSKRREQVGGLRARADEMATMAEGEPDSVKREIMEAVVRENRQLAEELAV